MTEHTFDRKFFATWLRDQREDLGLSEDEFGEQVGVSVAVVIMWEVGNTLWAQLPKEYQARIEVLCGKFPSQAATVEFRAAPETTYRDEIEQQIEQQIEQFELEDRRQEASTFDGGGPGFAPNTVNGYADTTCDRCPTFLGPNDDKCPNCKRAVDNSH